MYAVLKSFGLKGLNGFPVEVEADISGGMPALSIVGLPDSAVRESGDRVHAALKNLGFKWPDRRITINLAPADVRKTGPVYDLPLLLAVLAASGQLEPPPKDTAFLGELALDGSLRPVSGVLPMALEAAASGVRALYVPAENAAEAAEACGSEMQVYPAATARQVVDALRGVQPILPTTPVPFDPADAWNHVPDFADVCGQPLARRAMVIAAAGGHNVLLVGAPGTGKSMLARRLPSILPDLTRREALEALLAGRGDLPFLRWRESPVAGHEVVGQNGDEPLPGGVDDPAAHHPGGIAAKAHAHGQGLLAAGLGPLKGVIQDKGHPGEVAEVLQQGEQGKEDGHGGQHDAHHPGQHPVDTQNQGTVEPRRGV